MSRSLILMASLIGSSVAAAINITAEGAVFGRDNIPNLPQCATYADRKWQPGKCLPMLTRTFQLWQYLSNQTPVLDFDGDSCYNVAAISPSGQLNPGLSCVSLPSSNCRDRADLDRQNVYSRSRCNGGWCAHMYGYYFEKDVADPLCAGGHDHDWEHIVVWTRNDRAEFVAASAHGSYNIRSANDLHWEGTHPKIVYHKEGGTTHAFRFGNSDDNNDVENHADRWWVSIPLVSVDDYLERNRANFAVM